MSKTNIRIHKEMNLLPLELGKESVVNVFYGLIEKYNKQIEYKPLTISKSEMWTLGGFKQRFNEEAFSELMHVLTKPTTFSNKKTKMWGSIFTAELIEDEIIKIYVSEPYRKYLFYKKDIDLMTKAKKKETMSIRDLDYYDKELKLKKKYLVLLHKADLLGIIGKYNKRLYALLMQFNKSLKYFSKWEDFRDILEVPKSYRASDIEKQIISKAKKELDKFGVKIVEINKIKKGRSIDKIEIEFKINKDHIDGEEIIENDIENKVEEDILLKTSDDKELSDYKNRIKIKGKSILKNGIFWEFSSKLNISKTKEEVDKILNEYELEGEE